jgi:hypothetical protein
MPVLLGNHVTNTIADVNSRVRSIVNDNNAQLYPDGQAGLLNAVRNAYTWMFGQIVRIQGETHKVRVSDIAYTPIAAAGSEDDLAPILPVDIYFPVQLEFRLNSNEEYLPVERRQSLPARTQQQPQRVIEWEFRGNTIFVIASQSGGLFRITYIPLLGLVNLTTDPIFINNAVEAIAHYAAYELTRARGQLMNAMAILGNGEDPGKIPTGAKGFASMLLDHLVLNEQEIARRGGRFTEGDVTNGGIREYVG